MRKSEKFNLSKRSWLVYGLKLTLSLGLLFACFNLIDVEGLPEVFARSRPSWILLAFILTLAGTIVLPAVTTKRALTIGRLEFSLRDLVLINLAVRCYVLILPRAAAMSVRWYRYSKGGSGHDALALLVFERLVQLFTMMVVGSVALWLELPAIEEIGISLAIMSTLIATLLGLALAPFLLPSTTPLLAGLTQWSSRYLPAMARRFLARLLDAVQAFQRLPSGATGYVIVVSLLAHALFILAPYCLAISMQLEISLLGLAWIRPIVFLMTLLPFTVGGLGVREAGFVSLLSLYSIPNHEALALSLNIFLVQVAIGLVGAGTELWRQTLAPLFDNRQATSGEDS